jgi:hypothetical protein
MKLMKNRSFFVAGALLLASLFTTSCKEFMSNLDQPVSSYLSVSDTSVVLNLDTVYQIKANSINSDKAITYKCSDESIATVDANGLVTPVGNKEGDVEITVSVAASDNYNAGEQKVKIAVKQPLTFEALEDGSIRLFFYYVALDKPVVVTKNRTDKKEYTNPEGNYQYFDIDVKKGDKLQFESANDRTAIGAWNYLRIAPRSNCAVYGNVMSMISPDGKYHTNKTITKDYALARLLYGYRHWVTDHYECYTVQHEKYDLMVPATKLTNGCYYYLLANTGITKAPELPATEIPNNSYQYMFTMCGELPEAPAITVENVGEYGMALMFYQCSKLTKANAISVKTAGEGAFQGMFNSCVELTESPEINAKNIDYLACDGMFYNCQKLTKANAIAVEGTIGQEALVWMFEECVELTESPAITAESIGESACSNMFSGCQKLKKANAIKVKTAGNYAFQNLFANQPELTDVVAVNAETMGERACSYMFNNCPNLKNVPATLPATTLAERCYSDMFAGCTSLKKAPALPATDLKSYCYNYMFGGCSALTEAPELKAATLAYGCYCAMFLNCSKLNKVTCLATTNAPDALGIWLAGAGTDTSVTTRTLVRAEANTNWTNNDGWDWPSTNWYVPTGWTIDPAIPAE